ncbi:MAG TPA: TonB-dependent receptor, partial [Pyrinomonadaceae bacterium]|nr:TonB-dependent receptor [Pyrinomonadaceae bacterium]
MRHINLLTAVVIMTLFIVSPPAALSQTAAPPTGATLRGVVRLAEGDSRLHNVIITIVQLQRSTETDEQGAYVFENLPAGRYTVLAHMEGFPDIAQSVNVVPNGEATLDFRLRLSGIREEVTVTATGTEQSVSEALQTVTTLDATRIAEESHPALGEVLDKEPGVAKRSFGPGSSRPVIRGFDGDRVLVIQDGIRIGSLGSQSGDHGEPVDVLSLERLEVVKGPATLLYGSNAIGGVVNAVTGHDYAHEGWRGYFTGLGGTTNNQAGVSVGVEYGTGRRMFWGSGSGQRTGDYDTPIGRIPNSKTRAVNGLGGFGWYADKGFFSATYSFDSRRYGVPFAGLFEGGEEEEESARFAGGLFQHAGAARGVNAVLPALEDDAAQIDLKMRRHDVQFNTGFRNTGSFFDAFRLTLDYSDYEHRELEGEEVGTVFRNKQFVYRGVVTQRKTGPLTGGRRLTGSFGFSGFYRDYETVGAEALAPPVVQNNFAAFVLQELGFERAVFQFGGRVEHNHYSPEGGQPERSFTGFSGGAGVRVPLWAGGAFVFNYTHSYRAPALEELYNFGPHVGNLSFEIGNPALTRELGNGVEFSLRHNSPRVRATANVFRYNLRDFVFLAPVDEDEDGFVDIEDGLTVARYLQDDSRYVGAEVDVDFQTHKNLWVNLGFDVVDAELEDGTPLPRIPPLRGRVGLDARLGNFSLRPEAVLVRDQDELFPTETRTAGY